MNVLHAVHRAELLSDADYVWPWLRWPQVIADGAGTAGVVDALCEAADTTGLSPLEADIVRQGLALRQASPDLKATEALFATPKVVLSRIDGMNPVVLLELALLAYLEKRWRILEVAAVKLLTVKPWRKDAALSERVEDLLFELLVFAIYRPAMPSFVKDPTALVTRLENLASASHVADVLARDSIAATTFCANRLALEGKFDEALVLYARANARDGFRTPVFQQAQVLLPVGELEAKAALEIDGWIDDHVTSDIVFRHAPEGEHAVMVACEQRYFDWYGELYAAVMAETNPGALIHFHFINVADTRAQMEARLAAWESAYNIRLNYTLETNRIAREHPAQIEGICVCTRYLHLPTYLERYEGVTITDIDGWLDAPVAQVADFGYKDLLISSWIWRKNSGYWRLPWGNLAGGFISFAGTEKGQRYACLVSRYIQEIYHRNALVGRPLFYADQAGLFLCLLHAIKDFELDFGFLLGGFEQSTEQRYGSRHEGKQLAMKAKIEELRQNKATSEGQNKATSEG